MAKNKRDRSGHVSMWPDFFPRKKRERLIAWLILLAGTKTYEVRVENGWVFFVHDWAEMRGLALQLRLDVYTWKLLKFAYLDDAVHDAKARVHIINSSKQIGSITIYGDRNAQAKILSCSSWGWREEPTEFFVKALRLIFDTFDYGTHPSPGSLGQNALKTMLRPAPGEIPHRYSRPSSMLRHRLFEYGSGGRSDDFHLYEEYDVVYEQDFDNHYANMALKGVPVDGYERFGLAGFPDTDLEIMGEYRLCYVECWITVQRDNIRKFSPFYIRNGGQLSWCTNPGTYHGYYWSPTIKACLDAGYEVEIGAGWGWRTLDQFLEPLILAAIGLREYFKAMAAIALEEDREEDYRLFSLCADMTKGLIVSTLGRFGMRDYRLELVPEEAYQDGDEPMLDMEYVPAKHGSPTTGYYLHRVEEPDANHLTQILYYIISQANLALYKRCLEEEENGNTVIMTNYDALICTGPPTVSMVGLKQKTHHRLRNIKKRSYDSNEASIHPGRPRQ